MAKRDYRDVACEIVERYLIARERDKNLFKDVSYNRAYKDAIQMVLSVLNDKEVAEVKNFYKFPEVFK